tara:strand:- start:1280 stop:1639 length:360 start_codon:yes stop_codon:yes gene_type:complete
LWSLGHKSYVNRINNLLQSIYNIPKFEKVLSRSDYTFDNTFSDFEIFQPRMNILSKNLQRLFNDKNDFNQNNTLFVDDTINVHENNFKNLIQIRRFGSISHILYDTELSDLINKFYEMC